MKKIIKSAPQLQQVQHNSGAFIFGPLLLFCSGYCILKGLNLLPITTETLLSFSWDNFFNLLLSKTIHWEIFLFGCFLLLISLIIFIQAIRSWLNKRQRIALAKRHKEQWFLDYPWNPKGISDRTGRIWIKSFFATIMFSMIIIPLNWFAFFKGGAESQLVLVITIFFNLAMLVTLLSLGYYILYAVQHGNSYLSFTRFPFFPGEKMKVTFSPNRFSTLHCTLRFVNETLEKEHSSDDKKTIICYELYSEKKQIHSSPKIPKVPISFDIPLTSPVWDNQLDGTQSIYYWELEVEAEHPGIDFCTTFLLPVYEQQNKEKYEMH